MHMISLYFTTYGKEKKVTTQTGSIRSKAQQTDGEKKKKQGLHTKSYFQC